MSELNHIYYVKMPNHPSVSVFVLNIAVISYQEILRHSKAQYIEWANTVDICTNCNNFEVPKSYTRYFRILVRIIDIY